MILQFPLNSSHPPPSPKTSTPYLGITYLGPENAFCFMPALGAHSEFIPKPARNFAETSIRIWERPNDPRALQWTTALLKSSVLWRMVFMNVG